MLHLVLVVWDQEAREMPFILVILQPRVKERNQQDNQQHRPKKIWMHFEKDLITNCYKFWKKSNEKKIKEKHKYRPFQILLKQKESKNNLVLKEQRLVRRLFK